MSSGIVWLTGAIDVIDARVLVCVFKAAAVNRALLLLYLGRSEDLKKRREKSEEIKTTKREKSEGIKTVRREKSKE